MAKKTKQEKNKPHVWGSFTIPKDVRVIDGGLLITEMTPEVYEEIDEDDE